MEVSVKNKVDEFLKLYVRKSSYLSNPMKNIDKK